MNARYDPTKRSPQSRPAAGFEQAVDVGAGNGARHTPEDVLNGVKPRTRGDALEPQPAVPAIGQLDSQVLPRHIAIIMDGNGRWATGRGLPRVLGHRAGTERVHEITEVCCEIGIQALTLYAFSWENWNRPSDEIRELMGLLDEFLDREAARLHANQIRLRAIGRLAALPTPVLRHLETVIEQTAAYERMTLTLALSYGGRQEIVDATKRIAQLVRDGALSTEQIDEALFSRHLSLSDLPDPDLLIRTSGEQRISNFLLWQISYAELYTSATLWPDFGRADLYEAIRAYQKRDRRFGKTTSSTPTSQ